MDNNNPGKNEENENNSYIGGADRKDYPRCAQMRVNNSYIGSNEEGECHCKFCFLRKHYGLPPIPFELSDDDFVKNPYGYGFRKKNVDLETPKPKPKA